MFNGTATRTVYYSTNIRETIVFSCLEEGLWCDIFLGVSVPFEKCFYHFVWNSDFSCEKIEQLKKLPKAFIHQKINTNDLVILLLRGLGYNRIRLNIFVNENYNTNTLE